MKQRSILLCSVMFCLSLSGCEQQPKTYQYLMTHPNNLQTEYDACSQNAALPSCEVVKQASHDFMVLVNTREHAPEKFGQQILDLQTALITLQAQPAQHVKYQEISQQLAVYYAVIAATTSE